MRIGLLAILAGSLLIAPSGALAQAGPDWRQSLTSCRQPGAVVLSAAQTRVQLGDTFPVSPPLLKGAEKVASTIITFAIVTDAGGNMDCIHAVGGHPVFMGPAMESVKNWKFRPPHVRGQRRPIYGMLVLSISRTKDGIDTQVLDVEPVYGYGSPFFRFLPIDPQ